MSTVPFMVHLFCQPFATCCSVYNGSIITYIICRFPCPSSLNKLCGISIAESFAVRA